jgi:hypothetical protein
MNNEPVAWITMSGLSYQQTGLQDRPLYTRPNEADLGIAEAIGFDKGYKAATAKTLTDEEILEIYNDILIHDKKSSIKFAKAILRKAQEK